MDDLRKKIAHMAATFDTDYADWTDLADRILAIPEIQEALSFFAHHDCPEVFESDSD